MDTALKRKKKFEIRPIAFICLAFLLVIFIGSLLLWAPFSLNEGVSVDYIDALFTSTSATCVTGLVSLPNGSVADTYNIFGRFVVAALIQIGGLGAATLAMSFILIISNSLTMNQQTLIKESWNISSFKGLKRIFYLNFLITFIAEFAGAILIFFDLYFLHGDVIKGVDDAFGHAFFLSVSAFNNAGFDIFGNTSLISFSNDVFLNLIISLLIIFGGLGYLVIIDVVSKKCNFKKLNLHSKVVISMTLFLIVVGTLTIYLSENMAHFINNSEPAGMTLLESYFLSVSTRTAGFTTYNLYDARIASILLMNILMFIGASPGGTGGGIKTTTAFALFMRIRSGFDGKHPHAFKRSIAKDTIQKAFTLFFLSTLFLSFFILLIFCFEGGSIEGNGMTFDSLDYVFDAFSAFATVGLSVGVTPFFSLGSKICLILLMFIGRIGPMSISLSLFKYKKNINWKYVDEELPIG